MAVTLNDLCAQYRQGLLNAAVTAFNDTTVQAILGAPGVQQRDDIVSVLSPVGQFLDGDSGTATITATGRTREVLLTCPVIYSIFRKGGVDKDEIVVTRAMDLLSKHEKQVRVDDITLGGVVRWCFLTGWDDPTPLDVTLPNQAKGRLAHFTSTWAARARLTNI
jgi:hypothetical protein